MLWPATIYSVGAQTRHHAEPVKLKHFMAAAKGMLTKYNAKVDSFAKKICSLNQMAGSTNYHKMHLAKSDSTQPFWPSHFGPAILAQPCVSHRNGSRGPQIMRLIPKGHARCGCGYTQRPGTRCGMAAPHCRSRYEACTHRILACRGNSQRTDFATIHIPLHRCGHQGVGRLLPESDSPCSVQEHQHL